MISDSEIRGRLLTHFHTLRHNADGWVPANDIILSPDPVPGHVVGGVCQQLADIELIHWKPLRGGGGFAGMAKITGKGVAAVETGQCEGIEIRFLPGNRTANVSPAKEEATLQDKPAPQPAVTAAEHEWITAAEASRLLKPVFNSEYTARQTICKRAHNGLIRARAERFMIAEKFADDHEIPKEFWWAEGAAALTQNWATGDFETWIRQEINLRAFGVSFFRADIEKMLPAEAMKPSQPKSPPATKGGRPPADWWEDLLIEICFQHFRGDLKPSSQADVQRAMEEWITAHEYDAGETTVKVRARKVWQAIKREGEN